MPSKIRAIFFDAGNTLIFPRLAEIAAQLTAQGWRATVEDFHIAERIGKVRVLLVPYIACLESGDAVCRLKPKGETHTSAWVEADDLTYLVLACKELNAHDTGFEFLASIAELLRPRLDGWELERYDRLLEEEIHLGIRGEIDDEVVEAKHSLLASRVKRRQRAQFEVYRDLSLVGTVAEYIHGLWHDVQIRTGPEHLPFPQLRRRMELMSELFPPNPGYRVFDEAIEKPE